MILKKFFVTFLLIVFAIAFFQLFYFNRSQIFSSYDSSYWKDRFEHSQWVLPLSNRIIGDDGLFSYVGYTLIKGADPSKNNPETGPVGKYLIGLSIILFKSTVFYSLLFGFLSLGLFYLLSLAILKDKVHSFVISVFLFLDPLFFSQFWKSWVDIVQLFFLLLSILCLSLVDKNKRHNIFLIFLSGLSLGFFTQIKFPILLPLILALEFTILFKALLIRKYVFYLTGLILGIFLPNTMYFLLGHSFLDFLKLQKYIIAFYEKSQLVLNPGSLIQALVLGKFPLINQPGYLSVLEWWIMWPITFLVTILVVLKLFIKKEGGTLIKGLGIFSLSSIFIFSLIPSYPRYLVIVLPFLYLFFGYFLLSSFKQKERIFISIVIIFFGLFNAWNFLIPKSKPVLDNFYHNFSNQYFQDIYEEDISNRSALIDRNKFRFISQTALARAQIKKIKITEIERLVNDYSNKGFVKAKFTYQTLSLGEFSETKFIKLVKVGSEWKVVWDWNLLLNDFKPGYTLETILIEGKRGSIYDLEGRILAEDNTGYLISVNPQEIDTFKENEMLNKISNLAYVLPVRLQNTYLENPIPGQYIPLASTFSMISENQKQDLLKFNGLKLSLYKSRLYNLERLSPLSIQNTLYDECCSRIYSTFNYHGVDGPEKTYDSTLYGYDGGQIIIRGEEGNIIKKVFEKEAKNGQDVSLSL